MKNKNEKICLGDKVKDRYTGFTGIAVAKTVFINQCVQFSIAAKYDKKNPTPTGMPEEMPCDEQSLDIIDTKFRIISPQQKMENDEMLDSLEDEEDEEDEDDSTGGPGVRIRKRNY